MNILINNYKHNISFPLASLALRRTGRSQFSPLLFKLLHLFHTFSHLFLLLFVFLFLSDLWKLLIVFVGKLQHVLFGDLDLFSPSQPTHQLRVLPIEFAWIYGICDSMHTTIIRAVYWLIWLLGWTCLHHLLSDECELFLGFLRLPLPGSFIELVVSLETSSLFEDFSQWFLRLISGIAWVIAFNNLQLHSSFVPQWHIMVSSLSWLQGPSWLVESRPIVLRLLAELVNATWNFRIWIAKFTHMSVLVEVDLAGTYFEIISVLSRIVKDVTFLFYRRHLLR